MHIILSYAQIYCSAYHYNGMIERSKLWNRHILPYADVPNEATSPGVHQSCKVIHDILVWKDSNKSSTIILLLCVIVGMSSMIHITIHEETHTIRNSKIMLGCFYIMVNKFLVEASLSELETVDSLWKHICMYILGSPKFYCTVQTCMVWDVHHMQFRLLWTKCNIWVFSLALGFDNVRRRQQRPQEGAIAA